jgi:hypothetical protein
MTVTEPTRVPSRRPPGRTLRRDAIEAHESRIDHRGGADHNGCAVAGLRRETGTNAAGNALRAKRGREHRLSGDG